MKIVKGCSIILFFLAIGEVCSSLIGGLLPGNVFGMLLLFIALYTHIIQLDDVRSVAHHLTRNMTVFFVPASIGIMKEWGIIKTNWAGFSTICIVTTLFVLSVVGIFLQLMVRKEKKHE